MSKLNPLHSELYYMYLAPPLLHIYEIKFEEKNCFQGIINNMSFAKFADTDQRNPVGALSSGYTLIVSD